MANRPPRKAVEAGPVLSAPSRPRTLPPPGTPPEPPPDSGRLRQLRAAALRFRDRAPDRDHRATLQNEGLWLAADDPARVETRVRRLAVALGGDADAATHGVKARLAESTNAPAVTLAAAIERIIGRSDLLPIAYFGRGRIASRSVARIITSTPNGIPESYGTGFLVSRRLLLTNHHVLPDKATAARSVAEFDFENDEAGRPRTARSFALQPGEFYLTDERLDFSLVAVALPAAGAREYGWHTLIAEPGKIITGESVSIIQHPDGREKRCAVRDNAVVDVLDDFLHYTTDTSPGSSGSPVFNDQWEVVALHHSGVPAADAQGNLLAMDGTRWTPPMGDAQLKWIANEGVRVSRIVEAIRAAGRTGGDPAFIDELFNREESMPTTLDAPLSSSLLPDSGSDGTTDVDGGQPSGESDRATGPARLVLNGARVEIIIQGGTIPGRTESLAAEEGLLGDIGHAISGAAHSVANAAGNVASGVASGVKSAVNTIAGGVSDAAGAIGNVASNAGSAVVDAAGNVISSVADNLIPGGGPPPNLPAGALQPGDVLLYQGRGVISKGIMFMTDSSVSHAGLFLGGDIVGEALGNGLVRRPRRESFNGANWVIARRLRSPAPMKPVIDRGQFYLAQQLKYSYQQIVFLALLLIVKRVRPAGILGRLIQTAAAGAATLLNQLLESGKDLMICSEFVYRAYDEASNANPDPYGLQVPGIATNESMLLPAATRGVHPESVLARLAQRPDLVRASVPEAMESLKSTTLMPVPVELIQHQIETLLEEYMSEAQYGRPTRPQRLEAMAVSDAQIAAAVTSFAVALDSVRQVSAGHANDQESALAAATLEGVAGLPAAFQRLFRTAADFVTPEDLRRSSSLVDAVRAW